MISIYKTDYIIKDEKGERRAIELRGNSTETKPTEDIDNGTVFLETDTGKMFIFDGENQEWNEV